MLTNNSIDMRTYRECMPIYLKSPKVTITFIRRSKSVVQELHGLVHISDFKSDSVKCGKV